MLLQLLVGHECAFRDVALCRGEGVVQMQQGSQTSEEYQKEKQMEWQPQFQE